MTLPPLTSEKEFKKFNPIACYSLFGTLRPAADSGVCGALADRCLGSRQPTIALFTCTRLKLELWENSISSVLRGCSNDWANFGKEARIPAIPKCGLNKKGFHRLIYLNA